MGSTKLNYSKLRNGQKKNKSINEDRDFLSNEFDNMNNNYGIQENIFKSEKPNIGKENKQEELFKVFGDNINSGNLDYLNSLLKSKSNTNEVRDKSNMKRKKGHVRHKSNITELNPKNVFKTSPKKNDQFCLNSPSDFGHTLSMRRDLTPDVSEIDNKNRSVDENLFKPKNGGRSGTQATINLMGNGFSNTITTGVIRDNNNNGNQLIDNNNNDHNQERLFDQYFKKSISNANQFLKRSMSLENIQNDKESSVNPDIFIYGPEEDNSTKNAFSQKKSEDNDSKDKQNNFMIAIDQYIDYFIKSENSTRYKNIKSHDYMLNLNETKSQKTVQNALTASQTQNKILKHNLQQLELKINDFMLTNKKLSYELKEYKTRDEENKKIIRQYEQKIIKLGEKKEEYKYKLKHTQELLAKEKIDNENNLLALKKVLSTKINNKVGSLYLEKGIRDREQLLGMMYNMNKKDKDEINKSKLKERKLQDSILLESIYDSAFLKKIKDAGLQYDLASILSPKLVNTSEDEEILTNSMHTSSDLEISYEQQSLKNISKDQEIKYLKDRLIELTEQPDQHSYNLLFQEAKNSTRNKCKNKYKNHEFALKNGDIRLLSQ